VPADPGGPQLRLAVRHVRREFPRGLGDPEISPRGARRRQAHHPGHGEYAGAVNRVPAVDDLRSNMVRGGSPKDTELTARERDICSAIGPALRQRGLLFVGIDVYSGWLTEINVTSPTGIRAIKNLGGPDVAAIIWDKIEQTRGG